MQVPPQATPAGAAPAPALMSGEVMERMTAIERAVEAVAIEVERLGEGQRFVVQLLDAQGKRALGAAVLPEGDARQH